LDDTLAEAHIALASIKLVSDWDWAGSETEFKRALELAPGSAQTHYYYSYNSLLPRGKLDEAVSELRRAADLDPLSLIINTNLGETLRMARRYDEAIAQCRKTLELDSRFGPAHATLGRSYEYKGMYPEAIREFRIALEYSPTYTQPLANLGHAYALSGKKAEARKVLAELHERAKAGYIPPWDLATVYVALGEKEQAIASLEEGYEMHAYALIFLNVDPRFDSLHSEPRFQALVRRVGLRPEDSPAAHAASLPKAPPAR
jgi:tetratricopeptide (TPR) repeat protein